MSKSKVYIPPEREVIAACREIAKLLGVPCFRRNVGAHAIGDRYVQYSEPGMSDLWGWIPSTGRHWECEVKRPGEKPTEAQYAWLHRCAVLGAHASWVDTSAEFEDLLKCWMRPDVSKSHERSF